jgi:hypothetical protein
MSKDVSLADALKEVSNNILKQASAGAKDVWDGFSDNDKKLATEITLDAAKLQWKQLSTGKFEEAEWRHIDAQFKGLTSANVTRFRSAFWETIGNISNTVGSALGGLARKFITGGAG